MACPWSLCRSYANGAILPQDNFPCYIENLKEVFMDLAQQAKIVDSIHDTLDDFVGQRLKVRANMGRSKIIESEGVLMQVHPQLFIMEIDRKRGSKARQSYQYVDVLTGMVELSQNGEPLFEPFIPEEPAIDLLEALPVETVLS